MSYKTILVHLDGSERCAERISIAFRMAEGYRGHVVGLFAMASARLPSSALAEGGPVVIEAEARRRASIEQSAEKNFRDAMRNYSSATAEWRSSPQDALAALRLSARYADVVIAGQPNIHLDDRAETPAWFAAELVLSAGRPVIFIPYVGEFRVVGRRVLIAWDGGREAARAVTDALPLLERASHVDVVAFDPERSPRHGEMPGADISLYLARHGVKVTLAQQSGSGIDVGAQLLSRAADAQTDLIVMGAYGHSRLRELVLGGVTRTLLETMTVPVLMSH